MNYVYPVLRQVVVFSLDDAIASVDRASYDHATAALKQLDSQENPDAKALHEANDHFNRTLDQLGRMHIGH